MDFSGISDGKESTCNVGDPGLTSGDLLETGMATYSCILAWEIPWTEEPSGLQSMGSQRVRHDGPHTAHSAGALKRYIRYPAL